MIDYKTIYSYLIEKGLGFVWTTSGRFVTIDECERALGIPTYETVA